MDALTEKQKMLRGEPYLALDPELATERKACRTLLHRFNTSEPEDFGGRSRILDAILGKRHAQCHIEPPFRCDYGYNITLGKGFYANFDCVFLDVCPIRVGDYVKLGPGVHLYTATHPIDPEQRATHRESGLPITVEDNVWIGGRAIILPGVRIGQHSVVGAGSVVTHNVPPRALVAGNPARAIKTL